MKTIRKLSVSRLSLLLSAAIIILLGMSASTSAQGARENVPARLIQNEVLIGKYICALSSWSPVLIQDVRFDASGDVTHAIDRIYMSHDIVSTDDCSLRGTAIHTLVMSQGCTASNLKVISYDGDSDARETNFVCKGSRNKIVDIISELTTEIISPTVINSE